MILSKSHRDLIERLDSAPCVSGKAEIVRTFCADRGFPHFVYGFGSFPADIHNKSAMVYMTFPDEVGELYEEGGGVQGDPVAARLIGMSAPDIMDNTVFARDERYADHPLTDYFLGGNWALGVTYPFKSLGGIGSLTVFADNASRREQPGIVERGLQSDMAGIAGVFHEVLVKSGAARQMFGITDKERDALAYIAAGYSISDLSDHLMISDRAVEKRLQRARRKLGAKNTANAIYRAAVRGVI